jgi:hypothetical protein
MATSSIYGGVENDLLSDIEVEGVCKLRYTDFFVTVH